MSSPFWDGAGGPGASGKTYLDMEWDTGKLGGAQLPGLVRVHVQSKKRRIQQKKTSGSDGHTPTFRGLDPAQLDVVIKLWTPDQLFVWEAMLPSVFPNPNKDINKLSALDISHPATQNRGIKSVIVEDIIGPEDGPERGSKIWTLKCVEYIPVGKKATKTAVGSVAVTSAFQPKPTTAGHNTPVPPSQTDFGPNQSIAPAQGGS